MQSTVAEWTVRTTIDNVAVTSDALAAQDDELDFDLVLSDVGERYRLRRHAGVLLLFDGGHEDASTVVTTTKAGLARALLHSELSELAVEGDVTVMKRLLAYRIPFTKDFNIIEP